MTIYVEDLARSSQVAVVEIDSAPKGRYVPPPPSWSADSKQILYETNERLCLYDIQTKATRCDWVGQAPNFSPVGDQFLYNDAEGRLYIVDLNSGKVRLLPNSPAFSSGRWAADGEFVYFVSRDNRRAVTVIRLRDGASEVITFGTPFKEPVLANIYLMPK
jgi:Tol biopolymer transport system component